MTDSFHALLIAVRDAVPGSPEDRAAGERLAAVLTDPAQVAHAPDSVLPAEHPLRHEARLVAAAFEKATSGKPLDAYAAGLQGIDRRSPFFPWRRAIAAIAAFHARDDAAMERHLSGLEDRGPIGITATALRSLAQGLPFPADSPARESFARLQAASNRERKAILDDAAEILDLCEQKRGIYPKRWKDLCRRVAERSPALLLDFIRACLGRKTVLETCADNPRLLIDLETFAADPVAIRIVLAQAMEHVEPDYAAEILAELAYEKRFKAILAPREQAWLLTHLGELIAREGLEECDLPGQGQGGTGIRSAERAFREAIALFPSPRARAGLIDHLAREEADDTPPPSFSPHLRKLPVREGKAAQEARAWHKADPTALEPVLFLLRGYEKHHALPEAWTLLDTAAALAPIDPAVKQLRTTALVETIEKFISNRSPWAAEKRLAELSGLIPDADARKPYLDCLRWALAVSEATNPLPKGILREPLGKPSERVLPELNEPLTQALIERELCSRLRLRHTVELPRLPTTPDTAHVFLKALAKVAGAYFLLGKELPIPPSIFEAAAIGIRGFRWQASEILTLTHLAYKPRSPRFLYRLGGFGLADGRDPSPQGLMARGLALFDTHPARAKRVFEVGRHLAFVQGEPHLANKISSFITSLEQAESTGSEFIDFLVGSSRRPFPPSDPVTPAMIDDLVRQELDPRNDPYDPAYIGDKPRRQSADPFSFFGDPWKPRRGPKAGAKAKTKAKAKDKPKAASEAKPQGGSVPKAPGRPGNAVPSGQPPVKRGPGRPRKDPEAAPVAPSPAFPEKRKPGRPRKMQDPPDVAAPPAFPEKRKRGRPRKHPEGPAVAPPPAFPEKRKRGRPRKEEKQP